MSFENVKVGDNVLIEKYWPSRTVIGKVTRVTGAQFEVEDEEIYKRKFRKDNGWAVGRDDRSSPVAREWDEEKANKIKNEMVVKKQLDLLKNRVAQLTTKNITPEKLDAAIEALAV